jgi:hypothetical protein
MNAHKQQYIDHCFTRLQPSNEHIKYWLNSAKEMEKEDPDHGACDLAYATYLMRYAYDNNNNGWHVLDPEFGVGVTDQNTAHFHYLTELLHPMPSNDYQPALLDPHKFKLINTLDGNKSYRHGLWLKLPKGARFSVSEHRIGYKGRRVLMFKSAYEIWGCTMAETYFVEAKH